MTPLHPITIAKHLILKCNLWRSMQKWAYLWYLYSWLRFTLFSKETVSSSIEIHFLILSYTTRSGLSLVTRRSAGIVHGFSPRSTLIIRSLSLTCFTNSELLLSAIVMPCVSALVQHQFTVWKHMSYGLLGHHRGLIPLRLSCPFYADYL